MSAISLLLLNVGMTNEWQNVFL